MKIVRVDQQTLFSFSMTGMADFFGKKAASSTKSHIPISKRRDTGLSTRVSMAARRVGDTPALSDSGWSSIAISRHCCYTLCHTYARTEPSL